MDEAEVWRLLNLPSAPAGSILSGIFAGTILIFIFCLLYVDELDATLKGQLSILEGMLRFFGVQKVRSVPSRISTRRRSSRRTHKIVWSTSPPPSSLWWRMLWYCGVERVRATKGLAPGDADFQAERLPAELAASAALNLALVRRAGAPPLRTAGNTAADASLDANAMSPAVATLLAASRRDAAETLRSLATRTLQLRTESALKCTTDSLLQAYVHAEQWRGLISDLVASVADDTRSGTSGSSDRDEVNACFQPRACFYVQLASPFDTLDLPAGLLPSGHVTAPPARGDKAGASQPQPQSHGLNSGHAQSPTSATSTTTTATATATANAAGHGAPGPATAVLDRMCRGCRVSPVLLVPADHTAVEAAWEHMRTAALTRDPLLAAVVAQSAAQDDGWAVPTAGRATTTTTTTTTATTAGATAGRWAGGEAVGPSFHYGLPFPAPPPPPDPTTLIPLATAPINMRRTSGNAVIFKVGADGDAAADADAAADVQHTQLRYSSWLATEHSGWFDTLIIEISPNLPPGALRKLRVAVSKAAAAAGTARGSDDKEQEQDSSKDKVIRALLPLLEGSCGQDITDAALVREYEHVKAHWLELPPWPAAAQQLLTHEPMPLAQALPTTDANGAALLAPLTAGRNSAVAAPRPPRSAVSTASTASTTGAVHPILSVLLPTLSTMPLPLPLPLPASQLQDQQGATVAVRPRAAPAPQMESFVAQKLVTDAHREALALANSGDAAGAITCLNTSLAACPPALLRHRAILIILRGCVHARTSSWGAVVNDMHAVQWLLSSVSSLSYASPGHAAVWSSALPERYHPTALHRECHILLGRACQMLQCPQQALEAFDKALALGASEADFDCRSTVLDTPPPASPATASGSAAAASAPAASSAGKGKKGSATSKKDASAAAAAAAAAARDDGNTARRSLQAAVEMMRARLRALQYARKGATAPDAGGGATAAASTTLMQHSAGNSGGGYPSLLWAHPRVPNGDAGTASAAGWLSSAGVWLHALRRAAVGTEVSGAAAAAAATARARVPPLAFHSATLVRTAKASRIFVFGGWSEQLVQPEHLSSGSNSTTASGLVMPGAPSAKLFVCDTASGLWLPLASERTQPPGPLFLHTATLLQLPRTCLLFLGGAGCAAAADIMARPWWFDTTTLSWSRAVAEPDATVAAEDREDREAGSSGSDAGVPCARVAHTATAVGNSVYVYGGVSLLDHTGAAAGEAAGVPYQLKDVSGRLLSDLWRLDTTAASIVAAAATAPANATTNSKVEVPQLKWTRVTGEGHVPPARYGHSTVVYDPTYGGAIGCALIEAAAAAAAAAASSVSPSTGDADASTALLPSVSATSKEQALLCSMGPKLLIFGGRDVPLSHVDSSDGGSLNELHVFDCDTATWLHPLLLGSAPRCAVFHSAIVVRQWMVVCGGVPAQLATSTGPGPAATAPTDARADGSWLGMGLYLLDMHSLHWTEPILTTPYLSSLLPSLRFGHSATALPTGPATSTRTTSGNSTASSSTATSDDVRLLIFGGFSVKDTAPGERPGDEEPDPVLLRQIYELDISYSNNATGSSGGGGAGGYAALENGDGADGTGANSIGGGGGGSRSHAAGPAAPLTIEEALYGPAGAPGAGPGAAQSARARLLQMRERERRKAGAQAATATSTTASAAAAAAAVEEDTAWIEEWSREEAAARERERQEKERSKAKASKKKKGSSAATAKKSEAKEPADKSSSAAAAAATLTAGGGTRDSRSRSDSADSVESSGGGAGDKQEQPTRRSRGNTESSTSAAPVAASNMAAATATGAAAAAKAAPAPAPAPGKGKSAAKGSLSAKLEQAERAAKAAAAQKQATAPAAATSSSGPKTGLAGKGQQQAAAAGKGAGFIPPTAAYPAAAASFSSSAGYGGLLSSDGQSLLGLPLPFDAPSLSAAAASSAAAAAVVDDEDDIDRLLRQAMAMQLSGAGLEDEAQHAAAAVAAADPLASLSRSGLGELPLLRGSGQTGTSPEKGGSPGSGLRNRGAGAGAGALRHQQQHHQHAPAAATAHAPATPTAQLGAGLLSRLGLGGLQGSLSDITSSLPLPFSGGLQSLGGGWGLPSLAGFGSAGGATHSSAVPGATDHQAAHSALLASGLLGNAPGSLHPHPHTHAQQPHSSWSALDRDRDRLEAAIASAAFAGAPSRLSKWDAPSWNVPTAGNVASGTSAGPSAASSWPGADADPLRLFPAASPAAAAVAAPFGAGTGLGAPSTGLSWQQQAQQQQSQLYRQQQLQQTQQQAGQRQYPQQQQQQAGAGSGSDFLPSLLSLEALLSEAARNQ